MPELHTEIALRQQDPVLSHTQELHSQLRTGIDDQLALKLVIEEQLPLEHHGQEVEPGARAPHDTKTWKRSFIHAGSWSKSHSACDRH